MKRLLPVLAAALLSGCASYTHTRTLLGADGKPIGTESEAVRSVLMKGAIDKLRTSVKDGNYSRTVSASGVAGAGDAESITATASALGSLVGAAAKSAATK